MDKRNSPNHGSFNMDGNFINKTTANKNIQKIVVI
jgi:hypothetical protein